MELKRHLFITGCLNACLLIVPYGIETGYVLLGKNRVLLLIVPYGIETGVVSVLTV